MNVHKEIVEYTLIFKEGTELDKQYNGEFNSEDREDTDELFEQFQEQVEQYFEKTWVQDKKGQDFYELDCTIIYNAKDYK